MDQEEVVGKFKNLEIAKNDLSEQYEVAEKILSQTHGVGKVEFIYASIPSNLVFIKCFDDFYGVITLEIPLDIFSKGADFSIKYLKEKSKKEDDNKRDEMFGLYSKKGRNKANSEILEAIVRIWEACRKHSDLGALDTYSREMICSFIEEFPDQNKVIEYAYLAKEFRDKEDVLNEEEE